MNSCDSEWTAKQKERNLDTANSDYMVVSMVVMQKVATTKNEWLQWNCSHAERMAATLLGQRQSRTKGHTLKRTTTTHHRAYKNYTSPTYSCYAERNVALAAGANQFSIRQRRTTVRTRRCLLVNLRLVRFPTTAHITVVNPTEQTVNITPHLA